ncbi:MAG: phosphoribosylanthranilate isomerase [Acidaminococcus sp.]|jgi:phosphoribosylanthranilate isomerase|nr:phosphoribosylanthranilate isomerase [Acidaminococcus sp.]MCI2100057.1 phosphoribosylanthranilate isomerase [Acidaminococcus sp.]MCI2114345.1 phosphoribosylanthranilate isomerase [Acidaminococcus sp.]MCI2116268.1 phosphoribosylanthranilate isomerase [Acidaminococcus sp.]
MTKIKICGLRRREDADILNRYHPDFAGFIFYPKSRRYLEKAQAAAIRKELDASIKTVGVFVNADSAEILTYVDSGIIDVIQLHGDETPEAVRWLKERTEAPIWKAIRVRDKKSLEGLAAYPCDGFLLDAFTAGYGGAGKTFDDTLLRQAEIPKPYFMAGGLNAQNVGAIMARTHPYGVDVSSAVETNGFKDEVKIKAFIEAVRRKDEQNE